MITKRIIPCLDVRNGRVVKGTNFEGIRDVADPVEMARLYNAAGADCHDFGNHRLFLVRSGKDDAGCGGFHRFNRLEQNTVCKGNKFHGSLPPVFWGARQKALPLKIYEIQMLALNVPEC